MYSLEPSRCAEMIRQSNSTVVLTGAGISTAAGIPDFRGPNGLYVTRRYDPELVFEIGHFKQSPRYFYEFTLDFAQAVKQLQPTFTHTFRADLEKNSLLDGIITQNIDILHQQAGSRTVLELHGSYRHATCLACHSRFSDLDYDWWTTEMENSSSSPVVLCRSCSGLVKPDIVFFGESVMDFDAAEELVSRADLLLVLGSSLNVTPASLLPRYTKANTVVVNKGKVMLEPARNRFFVEADLDEYFRQVAGFMELSDKGRSN